MTFPLRLFYSFCFSNLGNITLCIAISLFATSIAYSQTNEATVTPSSEHQWSVLSYNIRLYTESDGKNAWPHRAETVASVIKAHDVAGLQEVLKSQLDDLQRLLPDYDFVGAGRDDGKAKGEYVPVFFRKDRFEKKDSGHFWLSKTPDVPGSKDWDAAITRMATWVVLKDIKSGKEYLHINTHFDHVGKKARQESARIITDKAKSLFRNLPAILTGDFNCPPTDVPYEVITRESEEMRWVDTLAGYVPEAGQPAGSWNGFKAIENNRIDFIFLARGVQTVTSQILDPKTPTGLFGSDHQPIQTIVKIE
ncbi:MAG: endonuclease/exonuclease/phosphatase family protein [Pirellula sp.]|jgi:endonuclease/exonuclease/phosphatase family metal-dependent hydrolase|nr:endonuclease/exonuclease/phosphatase family protein [Pirellula sp.]